MRAFVIIAAFAIAGCSGEGGDEASTTAGSAMSSGNSSSSGAGGSGGAGQGSAGGEAGGGGSGGAGGAGQGGGSAAWGPEECPAPPQDAKVGFDVGDQLADIVVKSCDGEDVSLTELCGADALFIFAAHGWCPLCKSASGQQEAIHDAFAGKNLASINVVVATAMGDPPDADYCKLWRDTHGLTDVATFFDPTGAVLALWPGGSSSLSAYVSGDRIIVSKLVHDADTTKIKGEIQKALDQ